MLPQKFWEHPEDATSLLVWADALLEAGDIRGEYISLKLAPPTPETMKKISALEKKRGLLVGPARPFLRSWTFDGHGLVDTITTETKLFLQGFEHISQLHPRLRAQVTALRKKSDMQRLAQCALSKIHYLLLEWTGLEDASLAILAPSFSGIKNLSLAFNQITALGLNALASHASSLEYLALGTSLAQQANGGAIGDAWVHALCENSAFHGLRAVTIHNYQRPPAPHLLEQLKRLPNMNYVGLGSPVYSLAELEKLKR
jgi:uncharacterized protein (TIGR02996 family)